MKSDKPRCIPDSSPLIDCAVNVISQFFNIMASKSGSARTSALTKVLRVLGNDARLNIVEWLKEPHKHFGRQPVGSFEQEGVCVTLIQQKIGLTQSTASAYLAQLLQAGLVTSKRVGQWTYYKRNEKAIAALLDDLRVRL